MAKAEWQLLSDGDLKLIIYYQKPNETSPGTSGCSTSWWVPINGDFDKAVKLLTQWAGNRFNIKRIEFINDWRKLRDLEWQNLLQQNPSLMAKTDQLTNNASSTGSNPSNNGMLVSIMLKMIRWLERMVSALGGQK